MILIFALPWLGVPLYLMLGGRKMRRLMNSKGALQRVDESRGSIGPNRVEAVLQSMGIPAATRGNMVEIHETVADTDFVLAMYSPHDVRVTQQWIESLATECKSWNGPSGRVGRIFESLAETVSPLL